MAVRLITGHPLNGSNMRHWTLLGEAPVPGTKQFLTLHRVATALNTPFRKVPGQGEDYLIDHSANVVLMNPRGDYHGFFKAPLDLAKMKVTYRSARFLWDE